MRELRHPPIQDVPLSVALAALGDPVRLAIVRLLSDGSAHLGTEVGVSVAQSTLSHHMKMLREAGVILTRPEGTQCLQSLRPDFEDRFPGLLGVVLRADASTRSDEHATRSTSRRNAETPREK